MRFAQGARSELPVVLFSVVTTVVGKTKLVKALIEQHFYINETRYNISEYQGNERETKLTNLTLGYYNENLIAF